VMKNNISPCARLLALVIVTLLLFDGIRSEAQDPYVNARSFAVLGATSVTSTGTTTVFGNLGVSPGLNITGFAVDTVTGGTIHVDDSLARQARSEATVAFMALANLSPTLDLSGWNLGGLTLTAGVYYFSTAAQLTGQLTLSGPGDFVFQIGSSFTMASFSSIRLVNSASASNIYFDVGGSATLGASSDFSGTILSFGSVALNDGASVHGRVISLTDTVTLNRNTITNPDVVPEPNSLFLLISGAIGLAFMQRKAAKRRS